MSAFKEQDYNSKINLNTWKKLFKFVKPFKKYVFMLMGLMVIVAAIDAVFPMLTKYAIDNFIEKNTINGIEKFIFVYLALVIIQVVNVGIFIFSAGKIETGVAYTIRKHGFDKLQKLSFSYYDKTAVGWIMARMTSDIQKLSDIIAWGLVDLVWGITMMIFIIAIMVYVNLKLALIALSVVPILVIVSMYFQQKILKAYRSVRKINSRITGAFNEGIMGAKTTKTLVTEDKNLKEFTGITTKMKSSSVKAAVYSSLYLPIAILLGNIGTGLVLWIGGNGVISNSVNYGTVVAFISYTILFFEPVRNLANIFAEMQSAQASVERIMSMLETKIDIEDNSEVVTRYGEMFNSNTKQWPDIKGDIKFDNVSFSYKEGETVLEKFNLEVKEGETIALVGETGSGKSTIVNLACRFYEPTKGRILIDGVDYTKRPLLWLQSNLGYVLQTPHLFSGTIKDNIRYAKLDASELEIIRAAKLVNAHDFIMKLDKGYDSEVGEGGNRLSTGEKQLISFARAVLANPRIFILDEATSSIDTEKEKIIQDAINKVLKGRTSFIIAHRLSTIRSADRILVVRNGKITEEGNHASLMKKKGYYYRLYTNQFKDEQEMQILNN
ncbi:ABC transporter ATP-binding protein [Abyssisolibacter fermentans]|uniref:ABC transporter ATP-binding protein n=1 Tax=Abyssisolibacter fermentans TaxID=1766203 RepID=UPI00082997F6|nr:ABC transporter ATP-binding protein [Abyssisolibacter fermentans]